MKKLIATALVALVTSVSAADFASLDVDNVIGRQGAENSKATTLRVGKEISGLQYGVQARMSKGKVSNNEAASIEGTVGKNFGGFTPFAGVGHDYGLNTSNSQNYGLVGAQYGQLIGPGYALAGVKTRVRNNAGDTKQTVTYATYSIPVAKSLALNINASRSSQDIKEKAFGVGLSVAF